MISPTGSPPESASPHSTPMSALSTTRSTRLVLGDHAIAQDAKTVDLDLHDVSRLEPDGGLAGHAHAGRGSREDQVSRLERDDLRQVGDQLLDPEDELAGAGVLHRLTVEPQPDAKIVRVGHLIGRDQLWPRG